MTTEKDWRGCWVRGAKSGAVYYIFTDEELDALKLTVRPVGWWGVVVQRGDGMLRQGELAKVLNWHYYELL